MTTGSKGKSTKVKKKSTKGATKPKAVECCHCHQTFKDGSTLDNHKRLAHQTIVTVKDIKGDSFQQHRGDDGMFNCPNNCGYKTRHAGYVGGHVLRCKYTGRPAMPKARDIEKNIAYVVPCGADITSEAPRVDVKVLTYTPC